MSWVHWLFYGSIGTTVLLVAASMFLGGMDFDGDGDVDFGMEKDFDHDTDHDNPGWSNFLHVLGFGRVPFSVLLMLWTSSFGIFGIGFSAITRGWLPGRELIALAAAGAFCLFFTAIISRFIGKRVPSVETYTKTSEDLIACDGVAWTTISENSGSADVKDDSGSLHRVSARTISGSIPKGTKVHVISYGGSNGYVVEELPG